MTSVNLEVANDLVVSLQYVLKLDDGEEIDRAEAQSPFEFLQGRGQIVPGLEQALYGMQIGDKKSVTVGPADGYGDVDPDNYETMPRSAFPADLKMTEGMGLFLRDPDTDEVYEAYVSEMASDEVVLDFNHPLAGETLHFLIEVVGLRKATSEEIAHGHVHDSPGHH